MNIADILSLKYPDADFFKDIILQDDGDGVYIREWNLEESRPSLETIESWKQDSDLIQKYNQRENERLNAPIYLKLDDIDKKSIRALRTNDTQRLQQLEQEATSLRSQLIR